MSPSPRRHRAGTRRGQRGPGRSRWQRGGPGLPAGPGSAAAPLSARRECLQPGLAPPPARTSPAAPLPPHAPAANAPGPRRRQPALHRFPVFLRPSSRGSTHGPSCTGPHPGGPPPAMGSGTPAAPSPRRPRARGPEETAPGTARGDALGGPDSIGSSLTLPPP
ncbi:cleavage and polyadenylation specificity factor subunit 6-like [Prinia subflava]|uniref:cleavage and polyadenylation specificity factor subunit 6-like n=1 Tax=Prinia subflava TaxID=208062 RepID=UPI002FE1634A